MGRPCKTPLRALGQGLLAGLIGNAIFTAYQAAAGLNEAPEQPPTDWSEAPPPAQVGQRVAEGVFDREVPVEKVGLLTNVVHWAYGTAWGAAYGVLHESIRKPLLSALTLTSTVGAADYTLLPAMHLYKPRWRYPASSSPRTT